ncbi:6961_t:CDS:10 [Acaulospora morrowiae]|uniref:6961_t:CDS:1 n=1 Tax=Acaulospora morrowiae TaxID=94023 RepID=A0A9N8W7C2_9GLOM|nr:6961_t:CDS:10 [Acaulospora morrowiae]
MVYSRYGNFVFSEHKNIISLAEECGAQIIDTGRVLEGYQLYIVEQWVCDKKVRPYNTVNVFTGVPSHKVTVCVIRIEEKNSKSYPEKLEQLFNSLEEDSTRPKDTDLGTFFVTNLSTFPSTLNLVLVPDGIYEDHYLEFYLNSNLRKFGCSGRSALSLKPPTDTQKDKFYQLYAMSEDIPFQVAVLELVKLIQTALYIFGDFPWNFIDGLLCDSTESALRKFVSTHKQNFDLRDNVLSPNLVVAILKTVVSSRNKLNSLNYQVGKDPFSDPDLFLSGVASFQKWAKIKHTRKLDQQTIEKVKKVYNRSKNSDGLKVHKVIKSKIEDISGISALASPPTDIETATLEEFGKNAQIDKLRYLWKGKDAVESDWFHGGKELGKSFLRGAKTGDAIKEGVRGVTGSISNLVDRGGSPIEKIVNLPSKSLSLPPNFAYWGWRGQGKRKRPRLNVRRTRNPEGRKCQVDQKHCVNLNLLNVPRVEYESTDTEASVLPDADSTSLYEDEVCDWPKQRSYSMSTYEYEQLRSPPICELRRSNSFTDLNMTRKQGVQELRVIDMDIQTYTTYESLRQREESLKDLIERLELIIEEYDTQIEQLDEAYNARYETFKSTETNGETVLSKQKAVSESIKHIDDQSGKLNYEIGVLEDKFKEAEDLVNRFCLKVQVMEFKMTQSPRSIQAFYNYLTYIYDQLKIMAPRFYNKKSEEDDE